MRKDFKYCPLCKAQLVRDLIDGRTRLCCPECSWINYLNPLPAVACVVKNELGEILLVKRANEPKKGRWSLPAGFVELNESLEEAALRELEEETGVKGKVVKLIGAYIQPSQMYKAVLTVGFLIEHIDGEPRPGDDACGVKYERIQDTLNVPFETHRQLLEEVGY
jgi:ADP-ribose pyrophosphatase YjhB (NUDIX family)